MRARSNSQALVRGLKGGVLQGGENALALIVFGLCFKACVYIELSANITYGVSIAVAIVFQFFQLLLRIWFIERICGGLKFKFEPQSMREPPLFAELLVGLFAKKRYRASLLQCLDEDFRNDIVSGISLRRAKWRYWAAAVHTIFPQLWAAIKRIGVIGIVADYVRGKLGGA